MSVQEMSNALRHVHNNLDIDRQWLRAKDGLALMTELERAQVWTALSSHTLTMDAQRAPVVLSQYRTLYKAALRNSRADSIECPCTGSAPLVLNSTSNSRADEGLLETLENYRETLSNYRAFLSSFNIMPSDDTQLLMQVSRVIQESELVHILTQAFKDELKADLQQVITNQGQIPAANNTDLTQLKAAVASIQAEKANEASLTKINSTLEEMKGRLADLTSKMDNSSIGALSTQVRAGTQAIETVANNHAELAAKVETIASALRVFEVSTNALNVNKGLAKAINDMSDACAPGIEKFGKMAGGRATHQGTTRWGSRESEPRHAGACVSVAVAGDHAIEARNEPYSDSPA
jgi:hypothetical protein